MEAPYLIFRVIAASQVLLLGLQLLRPQRGALKTLLGFNLFCIFCYLLIPVNQIWFSHGMSHVILMFFGSLLPASIWLMAKWFFSDDLSVPTVLLAITAVYLALLLPFWQPNPIVDLVSQLIKLGLVLHVIYLTLEGSSIDLVDSRRRLRQPLALSAAVVITLVITVEIWAGDTMPVVIEQLWSVLVCLVSFIINLYVLRLTDLFSGLDMTVEPAADISSISHTPLTSTRRDEVAEEALVKAIEAQMAARFYATHGATLDQLSVLINEPAYRLRATINGRMAYRNFNQFLNHYRITEASRRLNEESRLPILSIALDVGFKSLSSFNKAFKDKHQITPSEFRRRIP